MLAIGSIIHSSSQGDFISREAVHELRNTFTCNELFNTAWRRFINPWLENAYATLNLRTGRLEGHDEFSMSDETPYLILFKVNLESIVPEDFLTNEELDEYGESKQSLEQFCERYVINVKQCAKSYYQSHWDKISWYMDSVIEANLFEWYEFREVAQYA